MRRRVVACTLALAVAVPTAGAVAVPAADAGVVAEAATSGSPLASLASTALAAAQEYQASGSSAALESLGTARQALAAAVAERLALDPLVLADAWSKADMAHQTALLAALTQLGVPYRRNTSKPGVGFDCSGLTTYAWKVAGVSLTRSSRDQIRAAASRTAQTAQAGDLVYYPGHVMMWLGVGTAIVHSPHPGRTVEVTFVTARRAGSVRYGNPIG